MTYEEQRRACEQDDGDRHAHDVRDDEREMSSTTVPREISVPKNPAWLMPLDVYRRVSFESAPSIVYFGVEVRDRGTLQVLQAGLEFNFGEPAMTICILPPDIQSHDQQDEVRLIDQDRLRTSMFTLSKATRRLPLAVPRVRPARRRKPGERRLDVAPGTADLARPHHPEDDLARLMRHPGRR
ncbi:hypothetical protein JNUCC0626_12920 [Lentzea sp. JNUCC 0626]|uniref:hypothetical protein n=1 Tax=Lentzea sp. JNUCC 0626 TaxID=3367513 RepID=UPI00374A5082